MEQYLQINNCTISTPLLDIIKDTKGCLYNGKLKSIRPRGNNIQVTCPFHKGGLENKPSSNVYIGESKPGLEYGWFRCFSCQHSGPFYNFIAACFNISDEKAKEWLIENYADDIDAEDKLDLPEIILDNNKSKFRHILDENVLNTFEDFHPYMIQRKLAKRIIDLFEIKYDPKTRCVVFPVRDEYGKLTMLTRRSVDTKKFIIDKDIEKPVYLLYYMIEHGIQNVMLCESQLDSLTALTYGFPCIATMGSVSQHQINLINNSGIRVLYIMMDNDEAGRIFAEKVMKSIKKDILIINVKIPFHNKKDINDLSEEEFYECVETAEKDFKLV